MITGDCVREFYGIYERHSEDSDFWSRNSERGMRIYYDSQYKFVVDDGGISVHTSDKMLIGETRGPHDWRLYLNDKYPHRVEEMPRLPMADHGDTMARGWCPVLTEVSRFLLSVMVDEFFEEYDNPTDTKDADRMVPIELARYAIDHMIVVRPDLNLNERSMWTLICEKIADWKPTHWVRGVFFARGHSLDHDPARAKTQLVWYHREIMRDLLGAKRVAEVDLCATVRAAELAKRLYGDKYPLTMIDAYQSIVRNPGLFFDPGPMGVGWVDRPNDRSADIYFRGASYSG